MEQTVSCKLAHSIGVLQYDISHVVFRRQVGLMAEENILIFNLQEYSTQLQKHIAN